MTLYIEGRLRTRTWDDQNGNKRYTTEIYGDTMQMLSRKQDNYEKTPEPPMPEAPSSLSNSDDSDDLPSNLSRFTLTLGQIRPHNRIFNGISAKPPGFFYNFGRFYV